MRIGLNNIFTICWFILMLGCGGTLTYVSFDRQLFTSDMIIIVKLFLGLMVLLTIAVGLFLLLKFRILIVTGRGITSIRPFVLSINHFTWDKIKRVKWGKWELKATVFKSIEIESTDKKIIKFSDFEFENFNNLIEQIPGQSSEKKKSVYLEQAKSNLVFTTFLIGIFGLFMLFILWMNIFKHDFHVIHLIVYGTLAALTLSAILRRRQYKLTLKRK
jgi:hypothetical protein